MGRDVVIWSGGADSTLVLEHVLENSTPAWPVVALTLEYHPNLNADQLRNQALARDRYLSRARSKGHKLEYYGVRIECSRDLDFGGTQALLWICALTPYVLDGENLHFGYVREDDFWHRKTENVGLVEKVFELTGRKIGLHFPLEWARKHEVLQELRKKGVPDNCWFSCENPVDDKYCGSCLKCRELKTAGVILNELQLD